MHISVSIHDYVLFIAFEDSRVGIGERETKESVCAHEINANVFREDFFFLEDIYFSNYDLSPSMECGK